MKNFNPAASTQNTWPDFKTAGKILARLSGFRGYPEAEGREVFIEALMQCVSAAHAKATLALFDEGFPTLREVRDAVSRTRSEFRRWNPNPNCGHCGGFGFEIRRFPAAKESDPELTAASKCDCWGDYPEREEFVPTDSEKRERITTKDPKLQAMVNGAAQKKLLTAPKDAMKPVGVPPTTTPPLTKA